MPKTSKLSIITCSEEDDVVHVNRNSRELIESGIFSSARVHES